MDPHEQVSMDAEKIMSGSWDLEFMVKKTVENTCSNDEISYDTPGCVASGVNISGYPCTHQRTGIILPISATLQMKKICQKILFGVF